MKRVTITLLAGSFILLVVHAPAYAKSSKKELIERIEQTYKPTNISLWDGELKGGMTVMVITQSGAIAALATDTEWPFTAVGNGKILPRITPWSKSMSREFRKSERVLILDVKIDENADWANGADVIRVSILSVEAIEHQVRGTTRTTRYRGGLAFLFPRNYLATADFADIKKVINSALVSEGEYQAADSPATVKLGMTPQQVEEALGKPKSIIDLGAKRIYVYPDIKITFLEGKVADVQ